MTRRRRPSDPPPREPPPGTPATYELLDLPSAVAAHYRAPRCGHEQGYDHLSPVDLARIGAGAALAHVERVLMGIRIAELGDFMRRVADDNLIGRGEEPPGEPDAQAWETAASAAIGAVLAAIDSGGGPLLSGPRGESARDAAVPAATDAACPSPSPASPLPPAGAPPRVDVLRSLPRAEYERLRGLSTEEIREALAKGAEEALAARETTAALPIAVGPVRDGELVAVASVARERLVAAVLEAARRLAREGPGTRGVTWNGLWRALKALDAFGGAG